MGKRQILTDLAELRKLNSKPAVDKSNPISYYLHKKWKKFFSISFANGSTQFLWSEGGRGTLNKYYDL